MFMRSHEFATGLVTQSYEDRKAGKDVPDIASVMIDYYMNSKGFFNYQELSQLIEFISEIKDHPSVANWSRSIVDVISKQYKEAADSTNNVRRDMVRVAADFTHKMGKLRSEILDILIDDMIRYFASNGIEVKIYARPALYDVHVLRSADKNQLKKIKMVIMRNNYDVAGFVEAVNGAKSQTYTEANFYSDLPGDWGLGVMI